MGRSREVFPIAFSRGESRLWDGFSFVSLSGRIFENIRLPIFVNFTTIIRNNSINYNNVGILFGIYFILVIFVSNLNIFVYEKTHIF